MKLSYFTMPLHPPSRDYTQTLKEDREAIILADRLGFAEVFVGEHVTDLAETITSSLLFGFEQWTPCASWTPGLFADVHRRTENVVKPPIPAIWCSWAFARVRLR